MFLGLGRLHKPFGRKSPEVAEESAEPGKLDMGNTGAEETLVNQITSLEELVQKRTAELEEAKAQLQQLVTTTDAPDQGGGPVGPLAATAGGADEAESEAQVEVLFTTPNQPRGELVVPAEEVSGEAKDEVVAAEPADKAEAVEVAKDGAGASPTDLFSYEDEEENPLTALISALPEVSATELLREAKEIERLLHQWHDE